MIGDKELEEKVAILRNMQTKEQTPVPFSTLVETVRHLTKRH
jgi:histidyl-tRNA synthetase